MSLRHPASIDIESDSDDQIDGAQFSPIHSLNLSQIDIVLHLC